MKTSFAAIALAATLAQPAAAITFPSLTTIYVGTEVFDDLIATATVFLCTNVSGVSATIRLLVLSNTGLSVGPATTLSIPHGGTMMAATHDTAFFFEDVFLHPGVSNFKGAINIESTESGVFCSASITDAVGVPDYSFSLRLVRVNPHPGTVE
jgi:hypothetical protein